MNNIDDALKYLNRDFLVNASIIDPIVSGTAEVMVATSSCVMVKDKSTDVYMLMAEDLAIAEKLILTLPSDAALVVHCDRLEELAKKLGYIESVPCYQAVYQKERFILPSSELEVRLMREDEAEVASEMYGFTIESAIRHIRLGLVYGGYIGGETVAMIGMHLQGSMGLLEVKEKFRHRGYAEYLEKFLINKLLNNGRLPYCQIIKDNIASLSLQRKLGLDISKNLLYWLHKERPDNNRQHSNSCSSVSSI